jgi:ribonuclease E
MSKKKILIDAVFKRETRAVLISSDTNYIEEIEYQTANKHQIKANIYLAKVIRIERSLQAAFIDYGSGKNGFLPFSEIHPDYYELPSSDKKKSALANLKPITPLETSLLTEVDEINEPTINTENAAILLDEPKLEDISLEVDESELDKLEGEQSRVAENASVEQQYKLEDVIKKGQILLVQAQKEERGNKGASFTTYISLAGKYCVLMPNKDGENGISRRISNYDERKRLKGLVAQFTANQQHSSASVIVRTAGVGRSSYEIKRDYDYLVRLWNRIREVALNSVAPAFIHMEEDIIQKVIRDLFDHNVEEILIEGAPAYQSASDFIKNILPLDSHKVKEYTNKVPIFTKYGIEEQLSTLYQPIATLPSGGYIVINPTEALISIDVNSGKSTSEKNIEETAVKTNLEAAKEIARQAKLRDLSGLIVIDFIDMADIKNRRLVERILKECFARDKARIQIGSISLFGLLEMSRQRLRPSFTESNSVICSNCNGKGIVRADESNAMLILRTIENEVFKGDYDKVNVYTTLPSILYILNNRRQEIAQIEEKYDIKLGFFHDHKATSDSFSIEKVKLAVASSLDKKHTQSALVSNSDLYSAPTEESIQPPKRVKWKNQNEEEGAVEKVEEVVIVAEPEAEVDNKQQAQAKDFYKKTNLANESPRNRNKGGHKRNKDAAHSKQRVKEDTTAEVSVAASIIEEIASPVTNQVEDSLSPRESSEVENLPLQPPHINKALLATSMLDGIGAIEIPNQDQSSPDLIRVERKRVNKRRSGRFTKGNDFRRNRNHQRRSSEGEPTEPKNNSDQSPTPNEALDKITS